MNPLCTTLHTAPSAAWKLSIELTLSAGLKGEIPTCGHVDWWSTGTMYLDTFRLRASCGDCHADRVAQDLVDRPVSERPCFRCRQPAAIVCTLLHLQATATASLCLACANENGPGGHR